MDYHPPWWIKNGHFQSIYPSLFMRLDANFFIKERIDTRDQDFIDLDWARKGNRRLVILSHGLEGHSRRPYIIGMAQAALDDHWDALAWNFRSCSGEPNRNLTSYHSGATDDLKTVIQHALSFGYQEIALIGFSIGGNKTLLYLGKNYETYPKELIGAVVFSVLCDLTSCSIQLAKPRNKLYMKNFLSSLKQKLDQKKINYPNEIDLSGFSKIKNFHAYDGRYTAPMNGFKSAEDYWQKSSSKPYIKQIKLPTLMVSAKDDPFLTPECFPKDEVGKNQFVNLEVPEFGGHVGFMAFNSQNRYWSEKRAMSYLRKISKLNPPEFKHQID